MSSTKLFKSGQRKCYSCKRVLALTVDNFYKNRALPAGLEGKCKDCQRKRFQHWTPTQKLQNYRSGARHRHLSFEITKEEFMTFWQKPCYYCGQKVATIGLDRVDNDLGYTIENVVPCCSKCNFMKSAADKQEFIRHCRRIANRFPR